MVVSQIAKPLTERASVALLALIAHGASVKPKLTTRRALTAGGQENLGDDGSPLDHGDHGFPKTSFSTCRLSA
jgi:hypothetical protein